MHTPWYNNGMKNKKYFIQNGVLMKAINVSGKVSLPKDIIAIADEAFYRSKVTSITIPENITTIGKGVFIWKQFNFLAL